MDGTTFFTTSDSRSTFRRLSQHRKRFSLLDASSSSTSSIIAEVSTSEGGAQERLMKDLSRLARMLKKIQAVFRDAEEREIHGETVKLCLNQFKEVAYDIEYVLDRFDYGAFKTQVDGMTEAVAEQSLKRKRVDDDDIYGYQVPLLFSNSIKIPIPHNVAKRIMSIVGIFDDITMYRDAHRLREDDACRRPCSDVAMKRSPSSLLMNDSVLFGRGTDKKKIIQLLMSDSEKVNTVIPIVGLGGVGKTALAQLIYNDPVVCEQFPLKVWVSMSKEFDVLRVTREIVASIIRPSGHHDNNDLPSLQCMLNEALFQKRFLLILEDVWNMRPDMWKALLAPFYGVGMGKIIVTTQSETVVPILQTMPPHELGCLDEEKSWLLFQRHAFYGWEFDQQLNFEKIGRNICRKCGGLPLALKMVGGFLQYEIEEQIWLDVLNDELWELNETKSIILPALMISWNHLPTHLKPCYAYASLFPKGHVFDKKELITLWIAQGYIQPSRRKILLEDIAIEYFDELHRKSFFQVTNHDNFILHDMVHDLARSMTRNGICSFLDTDELKYIPKDAKHIFIRDIFLNDEIGDQLKDNEVLRTLMYLNFNYYVGEFHHFFEDSFPQLCYLHVMRIDAPHYACNLEFFYWIGSLRCLHYLSINVQSMHMLAYSLCSLSKLQTLKLQCYKLNMLPFALGKLINLRHLILRSNVEKLPKSICELKNLQTLDVRYCFLLKELPSGISKLSNLRHLMLCKNTCIPCGIKELINLQTLPCYFLKGAKYIGRLRHLVNLRESLEIFDLQNVVTHGDAKRANLKHKPHIESLKLCWTENVKDSKVVLDSLEPHANLKALAIRGYGGNTFPSWFGNPHFSNLIKISLKNFNCHEECKFLPLSGLPSLRSLYIENIKGIKRIGQDFWCYPFHDGRENNFTEVHASFLSLEVLSICNMPEWDQWQTMKNGDFPCLQCLHIWGCPKLELLPTLPSCLEEFQVMTCERLKDIALHDSSEPPSRLQKVVIQCCNLLKSIKQVPNLTHLEIKDCFNLKSLNTLDNLFSTLEVLKLDGCPLLQLDLGMRDWCDRHGVTYSEFEQTIEPTGNTSGVNDAIIYDREDDKTNLFLSVDCMELDISSIQNTGETITRVGDTVIFGREDDKKKIIKLLLSDDCSVLDISLVQIIGAGGIGKSTVAYIVYNDSMVCDYFDMKAWVHMPESIDAGIILKAIIESLTGISCYSTELNELRQIIREELSGKRFLIVLDNVRNGTQSFWGSFMVSLSIGAKGSIVMMTTRTEIISDLMGSIRPYHLNSLSDEHCLSILLEYAFDKQDPCIFPELIRTGKHIAAKCEGIPLAAKAVGSLLYFNEKDLPADSQYWKDVLESALWESDESLPALCLCYDYLPMHMKLCFKYCSLFPEGYIFEKDHLIRLWMSNGYLEPTDVEAAEDIGVNCFQELLRRSFFQCLHIYDFREQKYGIHDLFHNFAQRVAVDCFRVEDSKLSYIPGNISHISIVPCVVEVLEFSHQFKQQSDLCTFLFIPGSSSKWPGSAVHIENIIVVDDLLIKSRYLRTLDLSNTDIKELPDSIRNLKSLCYLGLNNTNIRRLPNSICSLDSLQSLELQNCTFLSDLPPNIKELTKLRCLKVFKESGFISMPAGIGELRNLRTLSNFNIGSVRWQCGIVELQNLLDLRGSLYIAGLENVVSGAQANQANLKMKGRLKTLTLHWFENGWESEAEMEQNALDVIQYLQPHTNLEELIIHGYFGSQFPTWLGNSLFFNLVSVTLDNCYECNVLPPLGQLPSLRFLFLHKLASIQTIGLEFCGSSSEVPRGFPSLEILKLWEMSELEEWNWVLDEDFPLLRRLSISMCFKLTKLPPLNHLRELDFHCCDRLPKIPRLNSLEYLKIDGFQKLESLSLPDDLPALKKLEISNCGRLSLVSGLSQLASVERIKVYKCPQFFLIEQWLDNHQAVSVSGDCLLPSACSFEVPSPNEGRSEMSLQQVSTQTTPQISYSNEQKHYQTGISTVHSSASSNRSLSSINMIASELLLSTNLGASRASIASHREEKSQSAALVGRCADGYKWYGFKELKCGEHLKIYFYQCCYPECAVRKWELSFDSIVRQMFYKGQHSHQLPLPTQSEEDINIISGPMEHKFQTISKSRTLGDFIKYRKTMINRQGAHRELLLCQLEMKRRDLQTRLIRRPSLQNLILCRATRHSSGPSDGKDGGVTDARATEIEDNGEPEKKRNSQDMMTRKGYLQRFLLRRASRMPSGISDGKDGDVKASSIEIEDNEICET